MLSGFPLDRRLHLFMAEKNQLHRPKDNKLKHCRAWLETTLLVKSDARTLSSAGLLAGEILLLAAAGLWSAGTLLSLEGPLTLRLTAVLKGIVPRFPLLAFGILISLAAAHMAQWGERHYRRGRMAAAAALVPVLPIILGALLIQPLLAAAPLLILMALWAAAELWWQVFLYLLRRLATFDYWAQLELESTGPERDRGSDLRAHREYLEAKKTALMERKLRWQAMAGSSDPGKTTDAALAADAEAPLPARPMARLTPRAMITLAICCLLALGGILWRLESNKVQVSLPGPAGVPVEPPQVVFWYQAEDLEASLLQDLVSAYNQQTHDLAAAPAVIGINQSGDLALAIFHAQLSDQTPDIMLLPKDLAVQLYTRWRSPAWESESASPLFSLWPDRPWRQRLALIISPTTKFPRQAHSFAAYLYDQLSEQ